MEPPWETARHLLLNARLARAKEFTPTYKRQINIDANKMHVQSAQNSKNQVSINEEISVCSMDVTKQYQEWSLRPPAGQHSAVLSRPEVAGHRGLYPVALFGLISRTGRTNPW